jgi:hypothetical protein
MTGRTTTPGHIWPVICSMAVISSGRSGEGGPPSGGLTGSTFTPGIADHPDQDAQQLGGLLVGQRTAVHGGGRALGQGVLGVAALEQGGDAGGAQAGVVEGDQRQAAHRLVVGGLPGGEMARMSAAVAPVSSAAMRWK